MSDNYDLKNAIPNKLLNKDGTITDLLGNDINNTVKEYDLKPAIPNKVLNPDGSYSTLTELLYGAFDTDLFVVVQELPETGDSKKIYLVPNGKGTFDEYHYHNDKWDPIGTLDISNLVTTEELQNALAEAKDYTDKEISKIVSLVPMSKYPEIKINGTTHDLMNTAWYANLPVGTMLLGTCMLTDVDDLVGQRMIREEIKLEVFEGCIQLTMTSTDVPPYEWRLSGNSNSTVDDWRPSVTQDYVNEQIDAKITQALGGEY